LAQSGSRKKRKSRQVRALSVSTPDEAPPSHGRSAMARGYARSRQRDDEARAALTPLAPGERPTAVTVGAFAALALAIANMVALIARYDPGEPNKTAGTFVVTGILLLVAWGMWRARYWAVLGMQTLLALTIVGAAVGSLTALNANAVILIVAILVPSTTLFWFLIKAMARLQMPTRPAQPPR
jgi:hypothetical protein